MLYLKVLGFNQIQQIASNLLFKGDSYLLIEILNHYVQVTLFKANPEKKKILIIKNFVKPLPEFTVFNALQETKALLKKFGKLNKHKIILSLDSSFTTTIYAAVSLVRSHPKETIDEADIDNLISQAIWRFFDRHRLKVAQKMNIEDVDVLLSDVRIRGIKLDGHKIVNPIGFKAKSVEIFFSQTFIVRELMRGFRDLLPKENIVLITETGTAISHVVSRVLEKDELFVANLFPNQTAVFAVAGNKLAHVDNFGWGENDLMHLLSRYLRVDNEIARMIIGHYSDNNASENFLRRFENILVKELQIFANGLESLAEDRDFDIYLKIRNMDKQKNEIGQRLKVLVENYETKLLAKFNISNEY